MLKYFFLSMIVSIGGCSSTQTTKTSPWGGEFALIETLVPDYYQNTKNFILNVNCHPVENITKVVIRAFFIDVKEVNQNISHLRKGRDIIRQT